MTPFIFGPTRSIGKLLAGAGRKTEEVNSLERLSLRSAYCRSSSIGRFRACESFFVREARDCTRQRDETVGEGRKYKTNTVDICIFKERASPTLVRKNEDII